MVTSTITSTNGSHLKEPIAASMREETQAFDVARRNPLALDVAAAAGSIDNLNQLLADTLTLQDLYKKHQWQASGDAFYVMHQLFEKHFGEQSRLVDLLAERVQTLGGIAIAMSPDVAEATLIPLVPKGREDTGTQIVRLLQAHRIILLETRAMANDAVSSEDLVTHAILVSDVLRTNELQAWFLAEQLQ